MLVTMVGCGSLGSLLAARMVAGGIEVQALQRRGAHLEALKEPGIVIHGDRGGAATTTRLAAASDDVGALAPSKLAVVLVKSGDTESVAPVQSLLTDDGVVLTLQNGLGNGDKLARMFGDERVAVGVATYGAYRIAPGTIGWGGDGRIELGPHQPGNDLSWVADVLRSAGLNVNYLADPQPAIWTKLALNLMTNPLTAITRRRNGELRSSPHLVELMGALGREAVAVARHRGVAIDFDRVWQAHLQNLETTAANKSSMLQDMEAGRTTEIDAIAKPLMEYANAATTLPYTQTLYGLIRAIEDTAERP